jgi:hypothetical protein
MYLDSLIGHGSNVATSDLLNKANSRLGKFIVSAAINPSRLPFFPTTQLRTIELKTAELRTNKLLLPLRETSRTK